MNLADFDTTLYFLDDVEVAYLRTEVEAEYAGDLRHNVMAILLDIFEIQDDAADSRRDRRRPGSADRALPVGAASCARWRIC